jgi:hypothetical protein
VIHLHVLPCKLPLYPQKSSCIVSKSKEMYHKFISIKSAILANFTPFILLIKDSERVNNISDVIIILTVCLITTHSFLMCLSDVRRFTAIKRYQKQLA